MAFRPTRRSRPAPSTRQSLRTQVIDRTAGNTGGLGGAFGYFWGTGNPLPFPECQPFKGSIQLRLLGALQKLLPKPE